MARVKVRKLTLEIVIAVPDKVKLGALKNSVKQAIDGLELGPEGPTNCKVSVTADSAKDD